MEMIINSESFLIICIYLPVWQGVVYIASDGGRVCRPLVIADNGISRIKEHHMKELAVCV